MHCRTCDYALWTIRPGPCPECGTPFRPSDFRFRAGNVAFRCPHCAQDYYGTSSSGHLEPSAFTCVKCGRQVAMDEMTIEPAAGISEADTGLRSLAWFDRAKLGVWRSWIRTVIRTLGSPADAMRTIPATVPLREPIYFAAMTSALTAIVGGAFGAIAAVVAGVSGSLSPLAIARLLAIQVGLLLLNIVFAVIGTLVGGAAGHVALVATGSARGGLERSMQACLMSCGAAYAVALLPCPCLFVVGYVWWGVCLALMYRVAHSTTLPRAIVATLAAVIVATVVSLGLALVPQGLGIAQTMVRINTSTTQAADDAADAFGAAASGGAWPATPLLLVADGKLDANELERMCAPRDGAAIVMGGLSASAVRNSDAATLREASRRLAAKLPPDNAPFRLGRAIFYYRDASLDEEVGDWLMVIEPRRDARGAFTSNLWTVVTLGGSERLSKDELQAALATRRAARAADGRTGPADPATVPDCETGIVPPLVDEHREAP
ncbi:MAG: hypothetical protein U0572_12025 [Phycisphaerales bacterium]